MIILPISFTKSAFPLVPARRILGSGVDSDIQYSGTNTTNSYSTDGLLSHNCVCALSRYIIISEECAYRLREKH